MRDANSETATASANQRTDLGTIDNAFEVRPRFARAAGGVTRHVEDLRRRYLYADGALDVKTKTLMALLWSVSARCEPCVVYYASRARKLGVSEAELGEALAVATTMGACVAETWAVKAFAAATAGGAMQDAAAGAACQCED